MPSFTANFLSLVAAKTAASFFTLGRHAGHQHPRIHVGAGIWQRKDVDMRVSFIGVQEPALELSAPLLTGELQVEFQPMLEVTTVLVREGFCCGQGIACDGRQKGVSIEADRPAGLDAILHGDDGRRILDHRPVHGFKLLKAEAVARRPSHPRGWRGIVDMGRVDRIPANFTDDLGDVVAGSIRFAGIRLDVYELISAHRRFDTSPDRKSKTESSWSGSLGHDQSIPIPTDYGL